MKVELIKDVKVIQSNPDSIHNYFGWPTAARLQNGKIAIGSSGFRLAHICPFGKAVISYSEDEGESYTAPSVVIDTPLDDRDMGITPFGKSGVIAATFNNTVDFQKREGIRNPYTDAYLETVTPEAEKKYYGSLFSFSEDCGTTFGPLYHSPVTSPHGPKVLADGRILWVGRAFDEEEFHNGTMILAYIVHTDGTMQRIGEIENIYRDGKKLVSCEPDIVETQDGTILCHIRVIDRINMLTIYQSESHDGGYTWTKPHQIIGDQGGAPAHLFIHSSGAIVSIYGYREAPFGIRAMFSYDNGKTWDIDNVIYDQGTIGDMGYPSTVELKDKSLLTFFYGHYPTAESPAVVMQIQWRFDK